MAGKLTRRQAHARRKLVNNMFAEPGLLKFIADSKFGLRPFGALTNEENAFSAARCGRYDCRRLASAHADVWHGHLPAL